MASMSISFGKPAAPTLSFGGAAETMQVDRDSPYEYDLVVIGGGSGGLACSKRAAELGAKVCVLDYVKPSPAGTTWGLGGTCVNVGCIPKKLMHQASEIGHYIEDASAFGWELPEKPAFKWEGLVKGVQDHIGGLNWGYRVALRDKNVTYINAYGSFKDAHTLRTVNKRGKEQDITAERFVVAVGGRPRYPDIPGVEYGISSDDLFSLQKAPGKTLVVGASYVALECAGFLTGLGFEAVVMVRSILLRGFDQEVAEMIGTYMETHGTRFIKSAIPTKIEKREADGKLIVHYEANGELSTEEFDTVLFAVGRDAVTKDLTLENVGVKVDAKSGKIITDDFDRTSAENVFAIGDVLLNKPELTPVAIHAGVRLAERLYNGSDEITDYVNIPTTVFTPLEYGCCGLSEEAAISQFGEENIEVYLQKFTPLEWTVPKQLDKRSENVCFAKLICNKLDSERVLGFHYLGPNAGEVTQGFGIAFQLKATKKQFDKLIGIHPTCAETFTTLKITRSSGVDFKATGC